MLLAWFSEICVTLTTTAMENYYTSIDQNELDPNMRNIIEMNITDAYDEEAEDYDLDYDPNELFYELQVI